MLSDAIICLFDAFTQFNMLVHTHLNPWLVGYKSCIRYACLQSTMLTSRALLVAGWAYKLSHPLSICES